MAIKTQLRLQQASGSLGSSGKDINATSAMTSAGSALASVNAADLAAILQVFGDSIAHIHGKADFTSQTPGLIEWETSGVDIKIYQKHTSQKLILDADGTGSDALDIDSAGGIQIDASAASHFKTTAGTLLLSGAAGGSLQFGGDITVNSAADLLMTGSTGVGIKSAQEVKIEAAAGPLDLDSTAALSINSSAGAINIGSDDVNQAINVGTDGVRTITVGEDASTKVDVNALAIELDAGSTGLVLNSAKSGADSLTLDASGGISIDAAGASNFTTTSGALVLSGAAAGSLQLGSTLDVDSQGDLTINSAADLLVTGSTGVGIKSGQEIKVEAAAGPLDLDSTAALSINSSAGAINVGNDAVAQAINVGTGAAARTISIGNETGATALDLDAGTGGVTIDSQGAGTIAIGAQADTGAINVGAAGVRTITVGNDSSTKVDVNATDIELDAGDDILIDSAKASKGLNINASNAAGGVGILAGTGHLSLFANGGDSGGAASLKLTGSYATSGPNGGSGGTEIYNNSFGSKTLKMHVRSSDVHIFSASLNVSGTSGQNKINFGGVPSNSGLEFSRQSSETYILAQGDTSGKSFKTLKLYNSSSAQANAIKLEASCGGVEVYSKEDWIALSGSMGRTGGGVALITSGAAQRVQFKVADSWSRMTGGYFSVANDGEFKTFVNQDVFTANTTLVGALNSLANSISSNFATLYSASITSDVSAGTAVTVTKRVGPDTSISDHNMARVRVYLNGQLLQSASSGGQGGTDGNTVKNNDYVIVGNSSTQLRFAFALRPDDLISVITVGA